MICLYCGHELEEDYRFCPICGTKAGSAKPPEQPEPPAICHAWFCCPKCGICFERRGQNLNEIEFGSCPHCGYSDKAEC